VLHLPPLRHRRARLRAGHRLQEAGDAAGRGGGGRMIKRRGRIARMLIVVGSAAPSILDGARGLWRSEAGRKWLVPLLVFLCVTGLVLVVAGGVEALAPFIYAIF